MTIESLTYHLLTCIPVDSFICEIFKCSSVWLVWATYLICGSIWQLQVFKANIHSEKFVVFRLSEISKQKDFLFSYEIVLVMTRAPVPTESFNPSKSSSSESDGGGLGPLVTVPTNGKFFSYGVNSFRISTRGLTVIPC